MKTTIVGAGMVGSTTAYRLLISGMASDIVMVDINKARALGEAEDLDHAISVELPANIIAGEYSDSANSDFIVVTAGLADIKGGTRLDLCAKNAAILREMIPSLAKLSPNAHYIIVTNPMDVMTYAAIKYSGLPSKQIIGTGTVLDSARFRYYLSQKLNVSPTQISAYSLGEHGDSQVPIYSQVDVRGIPLPSFLHQLGLVLTGEEQVNITKQVRGAAYEIIQRKGATYYGIASAVTRIIRAIYRDEQVILPVSTLVSGAYGISDVCLAVPTLLGAKGVERIFELPINDFELQALKMSAQTLQSYCQQI